MLNTNVSPGIYENATIRVDEQGRVTFATNGVKYVPLQAVSPAQITNSIPQIVSVVSASTVAEGVVQLCASIDSNSTTQAATPSAVKAAYDLANVASLNSSTALTTAKSANVAANNALTASKSALTAFNQMSGVTGSFVFGDHTVTVTNGLITSIT